MFTALRHDGARSTPKEPIVTNRSKHGPMRTDNDQQNTEEPLRGSHIEANMGCYDNAMKSAWLPARTINPPLSKPLQPHEPPESRTSPNDATKSPK